MAITRLGPNQDITAAKIAGQINFKNIIINGDMSIAQRGTSSAGVTGNGYSTVDRMAYTRGGATTPTWTLEQSTDVPSGQGFGYSFKGTITTAHTIASGSIGYFQQLIEAQNLQQLSYGTSNAKTLNASFWVKSNVTGTYIVELFQNDASRYLPASVTINSANTWEKKSVSFIGDTAGTINNDNGSGLSLRFIMFAGTTYTSGTLATTWQANSNNSDKFVGQVDVASTTSNYWQITGVQLEVGTSASDFEFLPRDINIQRCARYFVKIDTNNAGNNNTFVDSLYGVVGTDSVAFLPYENIVPFRTAPSLSQSAVVTLDEYYVAVRTQSSTSIASNNPQSRHGANIKLSNFSSMTRGNGVQLYSGGTINMDAEL